MAEHTTAVTALDKADFSPEKAPFDLNEKGNLSDSHVSLEEEEPENSRIEAVRLGKSLYQKKWGFSTPLFGSNSSFDP